MSLDRNNLREVVKSGIKYFLINILFPSLLLLFTVSCVLVIPVGNLFLKSPVMEKYENNTISCDKVSKYVRKGKMNYFGYYLSSSMFGTNPESTLLEYEYSLGYKLEKCSDFIEQERIEFCNENVESFASHHLSVKKYNNEAINNYKQNKEEYVDNSIIPRVCKEELNIEIKTQKSKIKSFKMIKGSENIFIEFGQGIVDASTVMLVLPKKRTNYVSEIYEVCLVTEQASFCKDRYTLESANLLYKDAAIILTGSK